MKVAVAANRIERAIRLYEDGGLDAAARLLGRERRAAESKRDPDRLAEIDEVVSQMRSHLDGEARLRFDETLAEAFYSETPRPSQAPRRLRRGFLSVAVALILVVPVMVGVMYALGPVGTCEADLNNNAFWLTWWLGTGAAGLITAALHLFDHGRFIPISQWGRTLVLPLAAGASVLTFVIGLIVFFTYTTCVE
jgi:anti-sigma factor RsiW